MTFLVTQLLADESFSGKVSIDQNSYATALEVKGGGVGNPLAVFERDVGSDGKITIESHATNPEIAFEDGGGSPGIWVMGIKDGDNTFRISQSRYLDDDTNNFFTISSGGNVGIGTTSPGNELEVNGTIRAKEVVVESTGWSDFVFKEDYKLRSLDAVAAYIENEGHLPDIPSAEEVAVKGVTLGQMNSKLLQKVEELTLYSIQLESRVKNLEQLLTHNAKTP